jgi:hypothetical protein
MTAPNTLLPRPSKVAPSKVAPSKVALAGNAAYKWDLFDPDLYVLDNYAEVYEDDRRILQLVRDYFDSIADTIRPDTHGIDAGAGANLYPALSMLPFCERVTLLERGIQNRMWLRQQKHGFSAMWDNYWSHLAKRPAYQKTEPREAILYKAQVRAGTIYKLPRAKWGMGTMFFVAESITDQKREFNLAVESFMRALKPGAPFAAAFMRESTGYRVGAIEYPAVSIRHVDVEHCLTPLVEEMQVTSLRSSKPLREGYHGMILALGRAGRG